MMIYDFYVTVLMILVYDCRVAMLSTRMLLLLLLLLFASQVSTMTMISL
jgi:hypothetical protein